MAIYKIREIVVALVGIAAVLAVAASFYLIKKKESLPVWHMVNCNTGGQQADCHVLKDQDTVILVDAGTEATAREHLLPFLSKGNIKAIEHFFISHPHTDHYEGLQALIDANIKIDNIYINRPPAGVSDFAYIPEQFEALLAKAVVLGSEVYNVQRGDSFEFPTTKMIVLEAKKELQRGGVNDYSIIMRWEAGGYSSLFTGDLNWPLGRKLVGDPVFKADFYKVPHHGVTGIAPDAFSDMVDPFLALVPAPLVLWNHPRGQQFKTWATKRYEREEMMTCVNGFNGTVSLFFEEESVFVKPEVDALFCQAKRLYVKPKKMVDLGDTDKRNNQTKKKLNITPVSNFLLNE